MKSLKKILSLVLAVLIICTVIPLGTFAVAAAEPRLAADEFLINGKIYTSNDLVKKINYSCACNIPIGSDGHFCCFRYVQQAYGYLWGTSNRVNSRDDLLWGIGDMRRTPENVKRCLQSAKPGAHLRFAQSWNTGWGHSMMFLKLRSDGTGAYMLDCNYDGRGHIRVENLSWKEICAHGDYSNSDIIWAVWYPYATSDKLVSTITKPAAPTINVSSTDVAVGDSVTVTWQPVAGATSYKVILSNGQEKSVTGTSCAFTLNTAGKYTATAYAINGNYTSNRSNVTAAVTAHNPSTVIFKDYDGTVLAKQTVKYNHNATAPTGLTRVGYTFTGWDGGYTNVRSDISVTATYKINTYNVRFFDKAGKQLGATQKVNYGSDATVPENKNEPNGYNFYGWSNQNYLNVGSDGGENGKTYDVYGIYQWYDEDLPISVKINSAVREDDGYYIYFDLTNSDAAKTRGRAVVTLKTGEGKLVETTESAAFSIAAGASKNNMEVFVPCDKSASLMEVIVVDSYTSGVPISQSASITKIDNSALWSDWSPEEPNAEECDDIESRTEYRYRDKKYTTSSASTLEGWTQYDKTTTYSGWKTSNSYLAANENREVVSRTVPASYKTQYVYKHYKYWNSAAGAYYYSYGAGYANSKGYSGYWETLTLDYQLSVYNYYDGVPGYLSSTIWFRADSCNQGSFQISTKVSNAYTVYDYRDITHTYYYYQWENWSDWSDSLYTATDSREVETRTTYRTIGSGVSNENNSGENRTYSGKLDASFAGQYVTLYIYKVSEASDWTNEFIGQTKVAEDGTYTFNYKLREEPMVESGDYTIAIGIEATTNLIVVGSIKAPLPEYTVNFYDKQGNIISTQTVAEGDNAQAPVLEDLYGYTFACWDNSFTNIHGNLDIMPVYIEKQYSVVLINWDNDTVSVKSFNYGDALVLDEPEVSVGYEFIGWDAILDGTLTVTENMIVTAKIEKQTFEVKFMDYDGNLINEQMVEYGDSPEIPEISDDAYVFLSWNGNYETLKEHNDGYDYFYITDTVFFTPEYVFAETVPTPKASVSGGRYDYAQYVELTCDDPDAVIYYTTDGSDPVTSSTAKHYRYPIVAAEQLTLKFYACAFQKNNSETVTETYISVRSPRVNFFDLPEEIANNADEEHYDVTNLNREKKYIDARTETMSSEEAESLIDSGWVEDTEAASYSEFNDWAIRETADEDLIDVITETTEIDGVTYSRYKSKILTFIRYGYASKTPEGKEEVSAGVYTCDYRYIKKLFVDISSEFGSQRFIVETGNKLDDEFITKQSGYTFKGLIDSNGNKWDIENDVVTEDIALTAVYEINEYDVSFYDYYGEVYETQSVDYNTAAVAPTLPEVEGYVFTGWDAEFDCITQNIEVHPTYVAENEYAYISLDYSSNQMSVGHTWSLTATVTPDELASSKIEWITSNPGVAVVDAYGKVTAIGAGTVVITAVVQGSGEAAECEITVLHNPAVELLLEDESELVMFNKTLRNITAGATVADVKAQFKNENIEIYNSDNTVLDDSQLIGTGDSVRLMNAGSVVDALTVVIVGDMDGNGKINNRDVSMLMRYLVEKETPNDYQLSATDVNGDGKVNNRDAAMIAQYLVGKVEF